MEKGAKDKIKKVVLIGPESTGKTELAKYLANYFNSIWIPEYARDYIVNLNHPYNFQDVEHIAQKQIEREKKFLKKANQWLFYDTYLIITKVWFNVVYKKVPHWLEKKIRECSIDLFLLCNTDIPWIPDPVRENGGEMRNKLFDIYKNELEQYHFPYKIISGKSDQRMQNAVNAVEDFFQIDK
ncbi:MAG: ATP-binding protein [Bacteroidota bacterium]|nr:ATP-binding protein [Bacteroidota bacterium]